MSESVKRLKPISKVKFETEAATIRAESVGPLRRIYHRFSPLPIFNVDPHYTGMDATVERNIETRGGKGEFYFKTRVWDYNSISQWTKKLNFSAVNG